MQSRTHIEVVWDEEPDERPDADPQSDVPIAEAPAAEAPAAETVPLGWIFPVLIA